MQIEELLRAGKVEDAVRQAEDEVRRRPESAPLRTALFQTLAVAGEWERVIDQLEVLAELDAEALPFARIYGALARAEGLRRQILAGDASPVIFGEPEPWMAQIVHGHSLLAKGDFAAAQTSLQEALDAAPATPGNINGTPCQWVADADLRFGPMLEALIEGRYFWVPFFRIQQIRAEAPRYIRDVLWLPAGFVWSNGGEAAGFIFVRYPGTDVSADGQLLMARKTDWDEKAAGLSLGCGQRTLVTEAAEVPLLELRSAQFTPAATPAPA